MRAYHWSGRAGWGLSFLYLSYHHKAKEKNFSELTLAFLTFETTHLSYLIFFCVRLHNNKWGFVHPHPKACFSECHDQFQPRFHQKHLIKLFHSCTSRWDCKTPVTHWEVRPFPWDRTMSLLSSLYGWDMTTLSIIQSRLQPWRGTHTILKKAKIQETWT